MDHKKAILPAMLLLFAQSAVAEEYQILGLELPKDRGSVEVANRSDNDDCGEYRLDKVSLIPQAGTDAAAGNITVLDPKKQSITVKNLSGGETAAVKIGLLNEEGKAADSVQVLLLKLNEDKSDQELLSRARTDSKGQATFDKLVNPGDYQIAIECGLPAAAWASGGGALGAVGITALAVGLGTDGNSSTSSLNREDTPPQSPNQQSPSL